VVDVASPKARWEAEAGRLLTKLVVFSAASAGLWIAGHHGFAVSLLVYSAAINRASAAANGVCKEHIVAEGDVPPDVRGRQL
jgi:hypothetical protein